MTDYVSELTDQLVRLGGLALDFGRINRITFHRDGVTPESDTDHTVMLGWLACALAARFWDRLELDSGLIAEFALVHDAVELYAGDTPTLRITDDERAAKAVREHDALMRIAKEFGKHDQLPWFPATIALYEQQSLPEARFVRALDKILPKITHLLDDAVTLRREGMTAAELRATLNKQREDLRTYAGDFPELLDVHAEMTARVCALLA